MIVSSSGASDFSTSPFWRRSRYGRIFSLSLSICSASSSVPNSARKSSSDANRLGSR